MSFVKYIGQIEENTFYILDLYDYGGHHDLYTGHQLFLTDTRALTIVVFDLRQELDSPAEVQVWRHGQVHFLESELTNLDIILLWLNVIELSSRSRTRSGVSCGEDPLSNIVIVGTHCDSLHSVRDMQLSMVRVILFLYHFMFPVLFMHCCC